MKTLAESLFDNESSQTMESLFDKDLIKRKLTFGTLFRLSDIETKESMSRPGPMGRMIRMSCTASDMYKTSLISKDSGQKVTKDIQSIAAGLATIIEKIPLSADLLKLPLYEFSQTVLIPFKQYYSSKSQTGYASIGAMAYAHTPDWDRNVKLSNANKIDVDFLGIKLHFVKQ